MVNQIDPKDEGGFGGAWKRAKRNLPKSKREQIILLVVFIAAMVALATYL